MAETIFSTDIEKSIKKFEKFGDTVKIGLRDFMIKRAAALLGQVKADTPVDKGLLRRSWRMKAVSGNGEEVEVWISNAVEYADHVEYGHRILARDGAFLGYVKGFFMLDKNLNRLEKTIEKDVEKYIESAVRAAALG